MTSFVVEKAAHFIQIDQPDAVIAAIEAVLKNKIGASLANIPPQAASSSAQFVLRLDPHAAPAQFAAEPDGRAVAVFLQGKVEESPGSTATRRRVITAGGDPRDSATESKPPSLSGAGKGERVG